MNAIGEKVVVILSGGMDSVCALYHSSKQYNVITALSFDYGSRHSHKELPYAAFHCDRLNVPHIVMDIGFVGTHFGEIPAGETHQTSSYYSNTGEIKKKAIPFRNGIMLSIAAGYAESKGAKGVVIAAHNDEAILYSDSRDKFIKLMSEAIHTGTHNEIKIIKPFVFMTKDQIARVGKELGVDFAKTWSCYEGIDRHCGKCKTCVERKTAFSSAGIADPTDYSSNEPLPPYPMD